MDGEAEAGMEREIIEMKPSDLIGHVNNLLKYLSESVMKSGGVNYSSATDVVQAAASVLSTLYGSGSVQMKQFQDNIAAMYKRSERHSAPDYELILAAQGALQSVKRELMLA